MNKNQIVLIFSISLIVIFSFRVDAEIYNITVTESIGIAFLGDSSYPFWFNNATSVPSGSQYSSGANYQFNVTWLGYIDYVFFESNYTLNASEAGNLTNYSYPDVMNFSDIFWIYLTDLPAQTFVYRWLANDIVGNWNSTDILNFTINKGTLSLSINASPAISVIYPNETTVTGTESNDGDNDVTYELWRDSTKLPDNTTPFQEVATLNAGTYVYRLNATNGTNWTADPTGVTLTLTVSETAFTPGGGSGIIPTPTKVTRTKGKAEINITSISANRTVNITIQKTEDLAVRKISFTVVNAANNVRIIITGLTGLPATISHGIDGKVYHYMNIEKDNITNSDINRTIIRFAVNKTWLTDNNVDSSNISLYRWENTNWNELPTSNVTEDAFEIYYEAESPGFSVFTIGTSEGTPEIEEACTENWSCTDWSECVNATQARNCTDANACGTTASKPEETQTCETAGAEVISEGLPTTIIMIAVALLILIVIVALIFILRNKRKVDISPVEQETEKKYFY